MEQIAEELRLRPYRELAEEHGIPFDELMAILERAKAETARLRARGMTGDEIIAMEAERTGVDPAELRREADELCARLNGRR